MTTRRSVLAGMAATATLSGMPVLAVQPVRRPALIAGTYARLGGKGLYQLPATGTGWRVGRADPTLTDISFGVTQGGRRYMVRETAKGRMIGSDRDGRDVSVNSSGGDDPCHVAINENGDMLAVANYSSGTVAVYPLEDDGTPGKPYIRQDTGSGPRKDRQAGPHAHWVGFNANSTYFHAVDLGADTIFAYQLEDGAIPHAPRVAWRAPAGSGPRHMARHPELPVAYVVTELANTLITLSAGEDGNFTTRATTSLLPAGWQGESFAAHIAIDAAGRRLYVSNRGHDSIAVFDLGTDGTPRLLQHIACGGHWPRFFLLLEEVGEVLVANERSGQVAIFDLLPDGRLRATPRRLIVPGVVYIDRV